MAKRNKHPIVKTIQVLSAKMQTSPEHFAFRDGADVLEILDFEVELEIELPFSYKIFLNNFNGGSFAFCGPLNQVHESGRKPKCGWSKISLMGLEEIRDTYQYNEGMNWKLRNPKTAFYTFIPFCRTEAGELLIFVNPLDKQQECPVFDACHEEFPNSWGMLYRSFSDFLAAYVQNDGWVATISYDSPTVAEFLEQQTRKP